MVIDYAWRIGDYTKHNGQPCKCRRGLLVYSTHEYASNKMLLPYMFAEAVLVFIVYAVVANWCVMQARDARWRINQSAGTLSISSVRSADDGDYSCVVNSKPFPPLSSSAAHLYVTSKQRAFLSVTVVNSMLYLQFL